MAYMASPLHKNPCPKGNEIYIFSWPFLGHYNCILGSPDLCLEVEKVFETCTELHSLCNSVTFLGDRRVFNAKEMQRHMKVFVKELFGSANLPSIFNRRFYPSKGDIQKLIYRRRQKLLYSLVDQKNLLNKRPMRRITHLRKIFTCFQYHFTN